MSPRQEGTPQGGPLSPLLSNILLDELDKELEKRGHAFCRYADDCNIYVATKASGERVMASITQFLSQQLKLTVNQARSAVDRPGRTAGETPPPTRLSLIEMKITAMENIAPMSDDLADIFDLLYRDNRDVLYKLALGLTGNSHDAEEVTQEAFLRAFRSYRDFREECAFSTWIYRIAINVANDYLRQRTKFPVHALTEDFGYVLEEIIDPNPANNPETELLANQIRIKCLHSLTECFPLEQRKVFCLAITLGLPHRLVAEILECSVGSVKTALHRAKERWFGYMEDRCQLINKSGSCSCDQWVRFGLSQGWITPQATAASPPPNTAQAREEIGELKALRTLYQGICQETADESYVKRMRSGIRNKEWAIFS